MSEIFDENQTTDDVISSFGSRRAHFLNRVQKPAARAAKHVIQFRNPGRPGTTLPAQLTRYQNSQ